MGGSKKTTVGYKYFLGMHMVLCHGPVDYLIRVRVDGKIATTPGVSGQDYFTIAAENLFGGDSREGGVSGLCSWLDGGPDQTQDPYLAAKLPGGFVPNFRGVVSVVLNQCYVGNNPYLKRWDFRLTRILLRQDGIEQWYVEKAGIPNASLGDSQETFTVTDVFTSSGTWFKRSGLVRAHVVAVGAGAGGASGDSQQSAGVGIASGGYGGQGGGAGGDTFEADELTDTVTVSVGVGGSGAPTNSTPLHLGVAGDSGGDSTFGGFAEGTGGLGGGLGPDATKGTGTPFLAQGGLGGGSSIEGLDGQDTSAEPVPGGHGSPAGAGGGGGGGGTQFGGATGNRGGNGEGSPTGPPGALGGTGGGFGDGNADPAFPATDGIAGEVSKVNHGGGGGGGGGGIRNGEAANGANGGLYGGGGGGGGGTTLNGFGGSGGDGADGIVVVVNEVNGGLDMNPAHMIRECLTDPDWGMGYLDADIDDTAFMYAADTLWTEGMGMSLLWDRQVQIQDFIQEVLKHINASLYVDRSSGKFVLKLIRDDYVVDDLVDLVEDDIDKVENFNRPQFGELTTSITVEFWDGSTGNKGSVSIQDIALERMQQAAINTTLQYPGFTNQNIALRVAHRDLKTLSSQSASCTVYTNRKAKSLQIGGVFKMTWPDYELVASIMRVTGIAYGDGKSNRIRLTCIEDSFAMPDVPLTSITEPIWEDPSQPPEPVEDRIAYEIPYLELVQQTGQSVVDSMLTTNPATGFVGAAARRTGSAINARVHTDSGSGFLDVGSLDFCPTAELDTSVTDLLETTFPLTNVNSTSSVTIGSWVQFGTEIMAVVSFSPDSTAPTSMEVERGCLDTLPVAHLAGEIGYFWDSFSGSDPTEYVDGESVNVRITPVTGVGELSIADAENDVVTLVSRAVRPYPPANLKFNGEYFPTASSEGDIVLTWAHRDRTQQTGTDLVGFTEASIGPEAGTTYRVRVYNATTGSLLRTDSAISGATYSYTDALETADGGPFPFLRFEFESVRDGFASYQHYDFTLTRDPNVDRVTGDGDFRTTEEDEQKVSE